MSNLAWILRLSRRWTPGWNRGQKYAHLRALCSYGWTFCPFTELILQIWNRNTANFNVNHVQCIGCWLKFCLSDFHSPISPTFWPKTIKRRAEVMCRPECCINYGWARALNWGDSSARHLLPLHGPGLAEAQIGAPAHKILGTLWSASPPPPGCNEIQLSARLSSLRTTHWATSHDACWAPGPYSPMLPDSHSP